MEKKNNGFLAPGMLKKYWLTFFATLSNSAFLITMLRPREEYTRGWR